MDETDKQRIRLVITAAQNIEREYLYSLNREKIIFAMTNLKIILDTFLEEMNKKK